MINDGSSDSSESIAEGFIEPAAQRGVLLTVITLSHVGLIAALEAGLDAASSEIVARMDADDVCEAWRLGRQFAFLQANPHIHVLGGQAVLLTETAEEEDEDVELVVATGIPTHPMMIQWVMMFRCCVLHPTVAFRKNIIRECGSYASALQGVGKCVEDYDLWLRVAERYFFVFVCLFVYFYLFLSSYFKF